LTWKLIGEPVPSEAADVWHPPVIFSARGSRECYTGLAHERAADRRCLDRLCRIEEGEHHRGV
jgi:hypothetical protein